MTKWLAVVALALLSWPAFAQERIIGSGIFGGSTGFLPGGAAKFVPTNYSPSSNDFLPADGHWTAQQSGSSLPTATTVSGVTLPDGTTGSVSQVSFGTVPVGTSNYSLLTYTDLNGEGKFPADHGVWARVISGTGNPFTSLSRSTTFFSTSIPNDGAWHQIVNVSTTLNTTALVLQLGINEFDTAQRAANSALVVQFTGDYFVGDQFERIISYANVKSGGPLDVTGSPPLAAQVSAPYPAHVANRDPSLFVPYSGNPIISEAAEAWRNGGVSNAFVQAAITSGGNFYAFSNCTSSAGHADWMAYCLFTSPTTDGLNWTEDTLNAPYLQAFGSSFTVPTKGTAAAPAPSFWQLHPVFLPGGCYDSTNSVARTFCVLYSGIDGSGNQRIYLAWATTIDGVYTPIGCAGPGVCSTSVPVTITGLAATLPNPGLVSVINIGSTNYVYLNSGGNNTAGTSFVLMTTSATNTVATSGNTLALKAYSSFTVVSGLDWYSPNGSTEILDPFIYLNHCGFYEFDYTALNITAPGAPFTNSKEQITGEAVSDVAGMESGTWWQYPAPTFPTTSSMYGGANFIGDQVGIEIGGQYILTLNFDNGTTQSRAMAATAPQGTCP
jgi:hypothetical protein